MSTTVESVMERLDEEYEELEQEWLKQTPEDLINLASKIATIQTGMAYIQNNVEEDMSQLEAYDKVTNILESFYDFQLGSSNGAITEETIEEFEDYLLEG